MNNLPPLPILLVSAKMVLRFYFKDLPIPYSAIDNISAARKFFEGYKIENVVRGYSDTRGVYWDVEMDIKDFLEVVQNV